MGDGTAVSKTGADLLGNRRFESMSLQRGVSCEPDFLKCVHPHVFVVGDRGFESSIALGGPISTSLLELNGFLGLAGWKWLYFLEAVPPSCRSVMIGWSTRYCWPTRKSSSTICIATWGTARSLGRLLEQDKVVKAMEQVLEEVSVSTKSSPSLRKTN